MHSRSLPSSSMGISVFPKLKIVLFEFLCAFCFALVLAKSDDLVALYPPLTEAPYTSSSNVNQRICVANMQMLVMQWSPSTCFSSLCEKNPVVKFTIVHVWPANQYGSTLNCDLCQNNSAYFDRNLMFQPQPPFLTNLDKIWPDFFGQSNMVFWEREWNRHGICSGLPQLTSFQRSISAGNYVSDVIAFAFYVAGIDPGSWVTLAYLQWAINTALRVRALYRCIDISIGDGSNVEEMISEVVVCYDSTLSTKINCTGNVGNCVGMRDVFLPVGWGLQKNLAVFESNEDEETPRSNKIPRRKPPPLMCLAKASKYYIILAEANALTKDATRDKSLEKLLEAVEYVCSPTDKMQEENKGVHGGIIHSNDDHRPREEGEKGHSNLTWPKSAVSAVVALEKAAHESLPSDYAKYSQKISSLIFNLKGTALLARRLLNKELEPAKILNMSSTELKEGLTEEEILARNQPEKSSNKPRVDDRITPKTP